MYFEKRRIVSEFLKSNSISAYDLQKITRDLCCCGSCKFYVQHYTRDGIAVDFGHCTKGNIIHSKKPSTASCGSWEDCEGE